jgi:hypothetical protein
MHFDYNIGSSSHEYILEYECIMTILSISKHQFNNPWVVGTHDYRAAAYHEFMGITRVCYMGMLSKL